MFANDFKIFKKVDNIDIYHIFQNCLSLSVIGSQKTNFVQMFLGAELSTTLGIISRYFISNFFYRLIL